MRGKYGKFAEILKVFGALCQLILYSDTGKSFVFLAET